MAVNGSQPRYIMTDSDSVGHKEKVELHEIDECKM